MQYLGGKTRLAKKIAEEVARLKGDRAVYIEPFVGGGSVFAAVAPLFEQAIACDVHPDLIQLWSEVATGWTPPTHLTEAEWRDLRDGGGVSALRGFAGFGCSFGGRFFEGYARGAGDYARQAASAIERKRAAFASAIHIIRTSYAELTPMMGPSVVAYCDPPYAGTKGYSKTAPFDHEHFWTTADEWRRRGALVLVSEYSAPEGWARVAEWPRKQTMRDPDGTHRAVTELLVA